MRQDQPSRQSRAQPAAGETGEISLPTARPRVELGGDAQWIALRELADVLASGAPPPPECGEAAQLLARVSLARAALDRLGYDLQVKHFACCVLPHIQAAGELTESLQQLSTHRTGALIAVEREDSLDDYIARGTPLDARLTADLLESLFHPGSRLHDGAVILRRGRVMAAGVFLPITGERREPAQGRLLGSRHRAALGLALVTDAAVFVVSEETGTISVGLDGVLHELRSADVPGRAGGLSRSWPGRLTRWLRLQAS
jgi:hypothetical protein